MRTVRVATVLRTSSVVIGGLGGLVGAFSGLFWVIGAIGVGVLDSGGFNSFIFAWMGTSLGELVSGCLGIAGAGFAMGGRLRLAAWFMIAGAAVALVSSALYTTLSIILAPFPEFPELQSDPRYPNEASEVAGYFLPTPLPLLIGATLALLADRTE